MIDLGPLGPMGPFTQLFTLCLIATSVIVWFAAKADARYWPIFWTNIAIVIYDRSFDVWCNDAGCFGGFIGLKLLTLGLSGQEIVSLIGSIMGFGAFAAGVIVLYFCRDLKLGVLIFSAYACMMIPYSLAVFGTISGDAAIDAVNVIGLIKLALIAGGGGAALAHASRGRLARRSFLADGLDRVAPWVVATENLAPTRVTSEANLRHQR